MIEIAITKTLRIQKKEDIKDKKNTLYIVVTQIDASLKEDVLKHKKNVDSKDVCNIKKCVCHRNLLIIRNIKKCVCLENNRSWLEDARKEKRCWVISESSLSQIWVRSRLDHWLALINFDTFVTLLFPSKIHVCMNRTKETQFFFTVFQFSVTCLNKAYEIQLKLLSSSWILLCQHSIIHCLDLVSFIWLCIVFNLDSI